ncbi:MAG: J domain-containing protein [Chlamydiota bacterium]|nr:J domain-containing protein [Chlamydiota bacterium]
MMPIGGGNENSSNGVTYSMGDRIEEGKLRQLNLNISTKLRGEALTISLKVKPENEMGVFAKFLNFFTGKYDKSVIRQDGRDQSVYVLRKSVNEYKNIFILGSFPGGKNADSVARKVFGLSRRAEVFSKDFVVTKDNSEEVSKLLNSKTFCSRNKKKDVVGLQKKYDNFILEKSFAILGLTSDATPSEVKKAFFKLSRAKHPDKLMRLENESDEAYSQRKTETEPQRTAEFQKIQAAKEFLDKHFESK